ncbi:hypothetical protein JYK14_03635 [Siccirubricoccus sp. KC 17139]|uniref:DUF2232 domain-containing protein n=1 Tax=Siccirubricoccus soli TaxID=2899147 RepID=A0ABT1D012_9PROT|nr:hypothetical protein [Siccirubricoccus soli]MCO6415268.1 hypothetical protein [Siccirubricoccus soli]MCP2681399.1 hypothetical protein [Siccirubricoccus soli]
MTATGPQQAGITGSPRLLAAGAAGFAAAFLMLWALRGMPGGTLSFWLASLPLFAAGFGFGPGAAALGGALAALLVGVVAGLFPAVILLAIAAVPVPLLLLAGQRPGGAALGLPLALLGLWPLTVLLLAALFLADDGGVDATLRAVVEVVLARLGVPASEGLVTTLVRVKAAALGFWVALALLGNAALALRLLARCGLAVAVPPWSAVRLPAWYPLLPPVAALAYLAAPEAAVPLSALLLLLVPLFLQGVAGVHRRLEGRQARPVMLAAFYLLLAMFLQVMGPGLVGLGLYDQFQRRAAPRNS